ncbi:hypothetical protein PIIN_02279 [Serendipita indica DSM 11827]|uniref:Uncharacterized protein n=1 Tax=Serendipita indica (strain DSM 11827) TaxID=1109443 RepID=G4TAT6_SERID|nr:hypothetical protein PIIN_02279 [Serendipita indica DSM 11827]
MPPKGKGKKGKKGDDDDFWANAGESVGGASEQASNQAPKEDLEESSQPKRSGFAGLAVEDDEDDDQDNFMVCALMS